MKKTLPTILLLSLILILTSCSTCSKDKAEIYSILRSIIKIQVSVKCSLLFKNLLCFADTVTAAAKSISIDTYDSTAFFHELLIESVQLRQFSDTWSTAAEPEINDSD